MALNNLHQPAKHWLADVIENFGKQIDADEDPALELEVFGSKITVRLDSLPGVFQRETLAVIALDNREVSE